MTERKLPMIAEPPRAVPSPVRLRILFGGFANQFGWFFFCLGLVFVWIFGSFGDIKGFFIFRGDLATAPGRVTHSEPSGFTEGSRRSDGGTPIYAVHYTFADEDGRTYEGVSYAAGQELPAGAQVTVEFPAGSPGTSRIRGMRRAPFGAVVALVGMFPLTGVGFLVVGLWGGLRAGRLLRHGRLSAGRLVAKKRTSARVNGRRVYKLKFAFVAEDGLTYEAVARTNQPETLEDEDEKLLLYDPARPQQAVLLDNLPGRPRFDDTGEMAPGNPAPTVGVLILPALAIIGLVLYLLLG
ncbi:MAG: DUF3592 domain-containing protein [Phycisphaerae bacterium]